MRENGCGFGGKGFAFGQRRGGGEGSDIVVLR